MLLLFFFVSFLKIFCKKKFFWILNFFLYNFYLNIRKEIKFKIYIKKLYNNIYILSLINKLFIKFLILKFTTFFNKKKII